jgi:hypothetical protein
MGFVVATVINDAAGMPLSCGSTGPSTACRLITISLAASVIKVPPDIA